MKTIYSFLFAVAMLCVSGVATAQTKTKPAYTECKVVLNGVNFSVDPRVELYHTMEVMAGVALVNFIDLDYKQDIVSYFEPYKKHPLLSYLKRKSLYGKVFNSIDRPMWFLINLDNDLNWRADLPVADRDQSLDSLRILMKDFAKATNYQKFYNNHAAFYNISLATITYNLPNFDEKRRLMDYCGNKNFNGYQFNVILNFLGWGNFGPRIFNKKGGELYAIIAPEKTAIRVPTFDVQALYKLLWHEFAHSFANPAVETKEDQFLALEHLWEPVKEPMKQQAYHTWGSVVKEHLTEAIACRMAALKFGEEAAELNYTRYQKGRQWYYLTPIINALKYYEKHRDTYPTLESFMPKLIEALKEIKPADIEVWAAESKAIKTPDISTIPIISDIYYRENILFITSTAEEDKQGDAALKAFMEKFKGRVNAIKDAKIVADTTALKMDLSQYNLSVWGTPKGNLFLKKYMEQIPFIIQDDKLIGETIYEGTGFGVLMGWVNPLNSKNVMAIYTGQKPGDIVDFNQVMNGAGNYHIIRNFISYRQGNFVRRGQVWMAK